MSDEAQSPETHGRATSTTRIVGGAAIVAAVSVAAIGGVTVGLWIDDASTNEAPDFADRLHSATDGRAEIARSLEAPPRWEAALVHNDGGTQPGLAFYQPSSGVLVIDGHVIGPEGGDWTRSQAIALEQGRQSPAEAEYRYGGRQQQPQSPNNEPSAPRGSGAPLPGAGEEAPDAGSSGGGAAPVIPEPDNGARGDEESASQPERDTDESGTGDDGSGGAASGGGSDGTSDAALGLSVGGTAGAGSAEEAEAVASDAYATEGDDAQPSADEDGLGSEAGSAEAPVNGGGMNDDADDDDRVWAEAVALDEHDQMDPEEFFDLTERVPAIDFVDAGEDAPTLHVFADPTCPHCEALREKINADREAIAERGVSIRWIPIGVLGQEAVRDAVLLLQIGERAVHDAAGVTDDDRESIEPAPDAIEAIEANSQLFLQTPDGVPSIGTPRMTWRADGVVRVAAGRPTEEIFERILDQLEDEAE